MKRLYQCETCGNIYDTENECEACKKKHDESVKTLVEHLFVFNDHTAFVDEIKESNGFLLIHNLLTGGCVEFKRETQNEENSKFSTRKELIDDALEWVRRLEKKLLAMRVGR